MRWRHSIGIIRAFTLIELLAVIAALTVLTAILLPALSLARDFGKRITCQACLRDIGQAWWMYFNDYDGKTYQGRNADVDFAGWKGVEIPKYPRPLNPYLSLPLICESERDARLMHCPADTARMDGGGKSKYVRFGNSYRANHIIVGPNQIPDLPEKEVSDAVNAGIKKLRIHDAHDLSRLPLAGDHGWVNQWWPTVPDVNEWHRRPSYFNLVYVDGHVAFVRIQKGKYVTNEYTVFPWTVP